MFYFPEVLFSEVETTFKFYVFRPNEESVIAKFVQDISNVSRAINVRFYGRLHMPNGLLHHAALCSLKLKNVNFKISMFQLALCS